MRFHELAEIVSDEPLFETGLLLAGAVDPSDLHRQLSRWTRTGRIHQLRRGLYALAPPWRKQTPHPFLVANRLAPGSYVSGLSALAFAHAIPEHVAEVTSVTTGRPHIRCTPLGRFSFRHVKPGLLFGCRQVDLGQGQHAFVAAPEKALLDLVHLHPGGDDEAYLRELRLDFDALQLDVLDAFAETGAMPKLARAAERVRRLARELSAEAYQVDLRVRERRAQADGVARPGDDAPGVAASGCRTAGGARLGPCRERRAAVSRAGRGRGAGYQGQCVGPAGAAEPATDLKSRRSNSRAAPRDSPPPNVRSS